MGGAHILSSALIEWLVKEYWDAVIIAAVTTVGLNLSVDALSNSTARLPKYSDADIVLSLPPSMTTDKLAWLSVWCEDFAVRHGIIKSL